MNREINPAAGESGVSNVLPASLLNLKDEGTSADATPLGGTIAMMVDDNGKLIAIAPQAFGSPDLVVFNKQSTAYTPQEVLLEPRIDRPKHYHTNLRVTGRPGFSPFIGLDTHQASQKSREIQNAGGWPDMILGWPLSQGTYSRENLISDPSASREYAAALAEEIYLGDYPNGIRLDSNEVYDNGPVWAATVCSHIVPNILNAASRISTEKGITLKEAVTEVIMFVPIGTDRQREVASFLDILAYFSGATFITVGANSSFGTPKGDAEKNLADAEKTARMIGKGSIPRGYAYSVADGLLMQGILVKMDPAARAIKKTVSAIDRHVYGGTFLANYAVPIAKIEKKGWKLKSHEPHNPFMLEHLACPDSEIYTRADSVNLIKQNTANLTQALNSVYTIDALKIPKHLPYGTEVLIIEAGGEGNTPAHAVHAIESAAAEQWARSDRNMKPTVVIASQAGIPYVAEDYSASPLQALKKSPLVGGALNAGGLPSHIVLQLAALLHYPQVMDKNIDILFDNSTKRYIDPAELQGLINDYGRSRQFPGFN